MCLGDPSSRRHLPSVVLLETGRLELALRSRAHTKQETGGTDDYSIASGLCQGRPHYYLWPSVRVSPPCVCVRSGDRDRMQTGRGPCHRIAIFNNITPRLLPRLSHITVTHLQETYLSEDAIRCCLEAFWETN